MTLERWSDEQLESFRRDGFVIVEEGYVDDATVERLRERFEPLFDGSYETGIRPDEVNWAPGRDPDDRTRQICNGWKADPVIAARRSRSARAASPPSFSAGTACAWCRTT